LVGLEGVVGGGEDDEHLVDEPVDGHVVDAKSSARSAGQAQGRGPGGEGFPLVIGVDVAEVEVGVQAVLADGPVDGGQVGVFPQQLGQ
jgi:hypothetical protein